MSLLSLPDPGGSISKCMSHMSDRTTNHPLTTFWVSFGIARRVQQDQVSRSIGHFMQSRDLHRLADPPRCPYDMNFEIKPDVEKTSKNIQKDLDTISIFCIQMRLPYSDPQSKCGPGYVTQSGFARMQIRALCRWTPSPQTKLCPGLF